MRLTIRAANGSTDLSSQGRKAHDTCARAPCPAHRPGRADQDEIAGASTGEAGCTDPASPGANSSEPGFAPYHAASVFYTLTAPPRERDPQNGPSASAARMKETPPRGTVGGRYFVTYWCARVRRCCGPPTCGPGSPTATLTRSTTSPAMPRPHPTAPGDPRVGTVTDSRVRNRRGDRGWEPGSGSRGRSERCAAPAPGRVPTPLGPPVSAPSHPPAGGRHVPLAGAHDRGSQVPRARRGAGGPLLE
jgi:hypothetical protein